MSLSGGDDKTLKAKLEKEKSKARDVYKKYKINVPLLHDQFGNISLQLGVDALPTVRIFNSEGKLAFYSSGVTNWESPIILQQILSLLPGRNNHNNSK